MDLSTRLLHLAIARHSWRRQHSTRFCRLVDHILSRANRGLL
jgi:hypothetical protein